MTEYKFDFQTIQCLFCNSQFIPKENHFYLIPDSDTFNTVCINCNINYIIGAHYTKHNRQIENSWQIRYLDIILNEYVKLIIWIPQVGEWNKGKYTLGETWVCKRSSGGILFVLPNEKLLCLTLTQIKRKVINLIPFL
jgi:hypothetical protein